MFFNKKFILASNSKSRFYILKKNRLNFFRVPPKCDEELIKKQKIKEKISPKKISLCLAKNKAASISKKYYNYLVVGSDTTIDLNNKIIEKAKNIEEAKKKIKKLSGKKHKIYSSAAAYYKNKLVWKKTQQTTIKVRKLKKKEINEYLKKTNKSVLFSVGCFQIEKEGPNIIENIKGDFFNVMGFPLFPFLLFLKNFSMEK
jgi:septum formation protein|tara:strand:+ start:7799 stop:8401 length:603 start_codon:yes stop_codon:yes gene_type:complete